MKRRGEKTTGYLLYVIYVWIDSAIICFIINHQLKVYSMLIYNCNSDWGNRSISTYDVKEFLNSFHAITHIHIHTKLHPHTQKHSFISICKAEKNFEILSGLFVHSRQKRFLRSSFKVIRWEFLSLNTEKGSFCRIYIHKHTITPFSEYHLRISPYICDVVMME